MHSPSTGGCTIGILRPHSTERTKLLAAALSLREADETGERIDEMIDEFRVIIAEAAKQLEMCIHVREYQVRDQDGEPLPLSRKRRKSFSSNDILVGFDPDAALLARLIGAPATPVQRSIMALSSRRDLEDMLRLVGTAKVPLVERKKGALSGLPRVFPLVISPNEEERSIAYTDNVKNMRSVLQYPHGNSVSYEAHTLEPVDSDAHEARPEFSRFLAK